MATEMRLDPKVHDLAAAWLSDTPATSEWRQAARVTSLARTIQTAIEDWCEEEAEEQDARDEEARSLRGYTDEEKARI